MFKILFYALAGITALLIYSWLSLLFLPATSRDASASNKWNTGAITLLFCVVSAGVWYLQRTENQRIASVVLYSFYGLLLLVMLWAVGKARWN